MFYANAGELLVVNAFYTPVHENFFKNIEKERAYITAYTSGGKTIVRIPHRTVVLVLEPSVPPWYENERLRCLWEKHIVFIKRKALMKIDNALEMQKNKNPTYDS